MTEPLPFGIVSLDREGNLAWHGDPNKGAKKLAELREDGYEVIDSPGFELKGFLFEQIFDGSRATYLYFNPERHAQMGPQKLKPDDFIIDEDNKKIFRPVEDEFLKQGQVLLASNVEEYGRTADLIKEILRFMNAKHECRKTAQRMIDVLYIFLTYIYDLLEEIPYREIIGRPGRAKSRYLNVMRALMFRGTQVGGASTAASLKRLIDLWRGSISTDEGNWKDTELGSVIAKIYCLGFSKSEGWLSQCDKETHKVELFNVYGPKIRSARKELKDEAAESRFIPVAAKEALKNMPIYLGDKFRLEAEHLRNKLLLWRFRNYFPFREEFASKLEDPKLNEIFDGKVGGRVKQILIPLYLLADDETKPKIKKLAKDLQRRIGAEDRDAQLLRRVLAILKDIRQAQVTVEQQGGQGTLVHYLGNPGEGSEDSEDSEAKGNTRAVVKLRDIAARYLGADGNKDKIPWISRKIASLLRNEYDWEVEPGAQGYNYVSIPLSEYPGVFANASLASPASPKGGEAE